MLLCVVTGCKDVDDDVIDEVETTGDVRDYVSLHDGETVEDPVVLLSILEDPFNNAFSEKFTNISGDITDETVAVVVNSSDIASNIDKIVTALVNGAALVIVEPCEEGLQLLAEQGYDLTENYEDTYLHNMYIYAFDEDYHQYIMIPAQEEDGDLSGYLNGFVDWLDEINEEEDEDLLLGDGESASDVSKYFDYQSITLTFPFHQPETQIRKVIFSSADTIGARSGYVTVSYRVYPLYSFNSNSTSGDFYIVESNTTVHSNQMYAGNYTNKHGGVLVRICGYYLNKLHITSQLYSPTNNSTNFITSPSPGTTIGSTSYTSGFEWNLKGDITGKISAKDGAEVSASIGGGVSFSNSETRSVSDISIYNNWSGSTVNYTFQMENLPKYNAGSIAISDPPPTSVSNADFSSSWVWHASGISDSDTDTRFAISTSVVPTYSVSSFITTSVDFNTVDYDMYSASSDTGFSTTKPLIWLDRPNRIPTGVLEIENTFVDTNVSIGRVVIRSGTETLYDSSSSTYTHGATFSRVLPTGNYEIDIYAGYTSENTKKYTGSTSITLSGLSHLSSAFNFTAQ